MKIPSIGLYSAKNKSVREIVPSYATNNTSILCCEFNQISFNGVRGRCAGILSGGFLCLAIGILANNLTTVLISPFASLLGMHIADEIELRMNDTEHHSKKKKQSNK